MARHRLPPGDDGHTISTMDITRPAGSKRSESTTPQTAVSSRETPLTRRETRWLLWGSIKAVLLVGAVFSLAMAGFALLISLM